MMGQSVKTNSIVTLAAASLMLLSRCASINSTDPNVRLKALGHVSDLAWAERIQPFDAFEGIDVEKLLGRAVPKPTAEK